MASGVRGAGLAREGAAVALAARTRAELAAVAAEIRERGGRALAVPTDVTQDAAVEALVEQTVGELGRWTCWSPRGWLRSDRSVAPSRRLDAMLAVNLRGVMVCCRAALDR